MLAYLCLLFPPFAAVAIRSRYGKLNSNSGFLRKVIEYCVWALVINSLALIVLNQFYDIGAKSENNHMFILVYLLVEFAVAFILAVASCGFSVKVSSREYQIEKPADKPGAFHLFCKVIISILIFLAIFIFLSTNWILENFGLVTAEKLFFQLKVPFKGTDTDFIFSFILTSLFPSVVLFIAVLILINRNWRRELLFDLTVFGRKLKAAFAPYSFFKRFTAAISSVCFVASTAYFSFNLDLGSFIRYSLENSSFIQDNYVDPKTAGLEFPENKRNLIYILMESMENTYKSADEGGAWEENYIPELTELSKANLSFSSKDKLGAMQLPGTGWTIAAMVAQTSGLPLKTPFQNLYNKYSKFLGGVTTFGDILKEQGYNQVLLVGSDSDFGGRKDYFTQHGEYKILDYFTAKKDGIIAENYKVWWGFEDKYLYEYAKKTLTEISQQGQPFNFTMLTVDTHHIGGYVCKLCEKEYDYSYGNVLSCASRQVAEFVEWIQQQDFYENTTIVIAGDHLSMETKFFEDMDKDYIRTTLNIFINPAASAVNPNNREFSTLDMFPTILASMGVKIPGNRLGLGANLFSDEPTLIEKYGFEKVEAELSKVSKYYYKNFL